MKTRKKRTVLAMEHMELVHQCLITWDTDKGKELIEKWKEIVKQLIK